MRGSEPSVEVLMPRYTRMVGWFTRTATLCLMVLLGGGPALAAVCEAVCVAPPAGVESAGSEVSPEAHQQHAPAAHHHGAQTADASHDDHEAPEMTGAARSSHSSRLLGQDCCRQLAKPRVSLAASRLDADILPRSHAALLQAAAIVRIAHPGPLGPAHGSPPGELSPVRTPLVLRI